MRRFERRATGDDAALLRRPRAQPVPARPAREVRVGLLRREHRDRAFDAHLAFEFVPIEQQRGQRLERDVAALARFVVREEHEAAFVPAAQQDDARRRAAAFVGRRQRHRVRFEVLGFQRVGDPAAELHERIGVGVRFFERIAVVAAPQVRQRFRRRFAHGKRPSASAPNAAPNASTPAAKPHCTVRSTRRRSSMLARAKLPSRSRNAAASSTRA